MLASITISVCELPIEQQGNAYSLAYSHQTRDYSLRANYTNVEEDFRADLGFQSQANYE